MKKALLLLAVAAIACQAKAQQLFQFKPADSLKTDLYHLYIAPKINAQPLLIQPKPDLAQLNLTAGVKIANYDHMPVAVLQGNSKMPVVKLNSDDRMPVIKLGGTDIKAVPLGSKTP